VTYVPSRRASHPRSAPSTSPASGANGISVVTLTTMPSAKPSMAPIPIATRTVIRGVDVHRRGDSGRRDADPLAVRSDVVAHRPTAGAAMIGDRGRARVACALPAAV
jgi:hypothetical protein